MPKATETEPILFKHPSDHNLHDMWSMNFRHSLNICLEFSSHSFRLFVERIQILLSCKYVSVCLSIYLSIYLSMSIYLSVCLSVCMSIYTRVSPISSYANKLIIVLSKHLFINYQFPPINILIIKLNLNLSFPQIVQTKLS